MTRESIRRRLDGPPVHRRIGPKPLHVTAREAAACALIIGAALFLGLVT